MSYSRTRLDGIFICRLHTNLKCICFVKIIACSSFNIKAALIFLAIWGQQDELKTQIGQLILANVSQLGLFGLRIIVSATSH